MSSRILEFFSLAIRQLSRRKVRVILTVAGIAIGVAALVGTVALGEGIRSQAVEAIRTQSDLTLLEALPGIDGNTLQLITPSRAEAVEKLPFVKESAPLVRGTYATKGQTYIQVAGIPSAGADAVLRPSFTRGAMFTPGSHDVVLGAALAEKLQRFEGVRMGDPLILIRRSYDTQGRPIDEEVTVVPVGVIDERGDEYDQVLLMDLDLALSLGEGDGGYSGVLIRAEGPDNVFAVADGVRGLGLSPTGSFEQIEAVNRMMDMVVIFLGIFAGLSLLVGGLMIASTMITSVYERTREIGIAMAVGASERDVMEMILTECAVLGCIGGIFGDLLGVFFATVMNTLGGQFLASRFGDVFAGFLDSEIALVTIPLLAAGLCLALGLSLLAGLYPAWKASRLNPVEAIRSGR
ncbi:MAG: macrolide transporter ATP-binding /permease protein [Methanoregulaceae archaeon PtaB.Bin108]|nr:MAG: macrolide transporter ATP-binding /permease protein [Methanoregulaceae archaeon PtaB.Bin108]